MGVELNDMCGYTKELKITTHSVDRYLERFMNLNPKLITKKSPKRLIANIILKRLIDNYYKFNLEDG